MHPPTSSLHIKQGFLAKIILITKRYTVCLQIYIKSPIYNTILSNPMEQNRFQMSVDVH